MAESPSQSGTLLNFFQKSASKSASTIVKLEQTEPVGTPARRGSGKPRGEIDQGTEGDPVVISDDDEPVLIQPPKPNKSSPISMKEIRASPVAGPSRLRDSPPPKIPTPGIEDRNPFQGIPGFVSPVTWPTIVNTADREGDEDEILNIDEDGDGSVKMVESDEEDNLVDEEAENLPVQEEDVDDVVMLEPPPQPLRTPSTTTRLPAPDTEEINLDTTMEWDEPEDEGMGMEEEGDEEASEIIATPPPVAMKRKRGDKGDKTEVCPVCGTSLKGKHNTVRC